MGWTPRPKRQDGEEMNAEWRRHPALRGRVLMMMNGATPPGRQGLMMISCWVGHPALRGRVERRIVGLYTPP